MTTPCPIDECSICLDADSDVVLECTHAFCTKCIQAWQAKENNCPICRSAVLKRMTGSFRKT